MTCMETGDLRKRILYALDSALSLSSGASKEQLLKAMDGHILAQAELMGTFSK